jgi:cobalt/nickel transport system permease protein
MRAPRLSPLVFLIRWRRCIGLPGCGLVTAILVASDHGPVPLVRTDAAAVVLPFTMVFAVISLAAGEPLAAMALVGKSYLSALAVLVLLSTTPLPELLHGLEHLGVPRYLLMVVQFLYRYLFVISEEAQHMRAAAQVKSGSVRRVLFDRSKFGAAAGALGVLFARSYAHAEGIHQGMLARGFQDHFRTLSRHAFRRADAIFLMTSVVLLAGARAAIEAWT